MAATTIRGDGNQKVPKGKRAFKIEQEVGTYPPAAKISKDAIMEGQFIPPFAVLLDEGWEPFGTKGWLIHKANMNGGNPDQLKLKIDDPDQCKIRIVRQNHTGPSEDHHQNAWVQNDGTLIINQSTHIVKVNVHDSSSSDVDVDSRCP